jgi:hypothetical protein
MPKPPFWDTPRGMTIILAILLILSCAIGAFSGYGWSLYLTALLARPSSTTLQLVLPPGTIITIPQGPTK